MQPKIVVCPTVEEFDRVAADWVCRHLSQPRPVLGLATGSSPIGLYEELVRRYEAGEISFKEARVFNLDEYVGLGPDHEQSYAHFMRVNLFDHVDIDLERTHIPSGVAGDPHEEARRYDRLMAEFGPVDAQVLGIGVNAHIGFNEPGTPFDARTHVVTLAQETIDANARFFADPAQVPREAITVGIANILESKEILLLARGANKAEALRRSFFEPATTDVPASALQSHPAVTLVVDPEAASQLPL